MNQRLNALAAIMMASLSLAGCGGGSDTASNAGSATQPVSAPVPVSPPTSTAPNAPQASLSWSAPYKISNSFSGRVAYPDVGIAADGFAVGIFVQPAPLENAVFGAVRQSASDKWDTPVNLTPAGQKPVAITPATGSAETPAANRVVVNRSTGDATVAWVAEADTAFPAGRAIWQATYHRAANTWTAAKRLGYTSSMPAMAINRKGDVAVAWMAPGATLSTNSLQGYLLSGSTAKAIGPIDVGYLPGTPKIAIDGTGNISLAWLSVTSGRRELRSAKVLANGAVSSVQVVADSASTDIDFSLAASENGMAVLGIVHDTQVYAARLAPGSVSWQAPVYIAGNTMNYLPQVAINGAGDALLMFSGASYSSATYYERTPWVASYAATSGTWTPASELSSATAGVGQPRLFLNDDGSALLSMRGMIVMTWRRNAGTTSWARTTHDLSGIAPVAAMDPVSDKAALLWIGDNVDAAQSGLQGAVLR